MENIINRGLNSLKMEKYATINLSKFPVVSVIFTGTQANDENFMQYLFELEQIYKQQKKLAIIFDASKAVIPGVSYQKMQAKWLKDNKKLMTNYCAGTAYVIPSLLIRNVLKAIFTFQKQPVDYTICKNETEAIDWVNKKLN
jgi:hypothetical protein